MARELGVKFEAQRLAAHDESRRNEGAIGALLHAEECMQAQIAFWKAEAAKGNCDAEKAQQYRDIIEDCCGVVRNLKLAADQNLVAQRGKLAQAEASLDACQEAFDYEGRAIEEVMNALAEAEKPQDATQPDTDPKARRVGERPAESLASKRKAKATA
jgi:hypothetical protein